MTVHVGEVHTQVSTGASGNGADAPGEQRDVRTSRRPGAPEDAWRGAEGLVRELRRRVAAEGFDD